MNTKKISNVRSSYHTNKKLQSGNGGNGKTPFKTGFYYSQNFAVTNQFTESSTSINQ